MTAIAIQPAWTKALEHRHARFLDGDRRAGRLRRDGADRGDEALQRLGIARIALGEHLEPRAAVGRDPGAAQILGQALQRHRRGRQRGPHRLETLPEAGDDALVEIVQHILVLTVRHRLERRGEAGCRPFRIGAGDLPQVARAGRDRGEIGGSVRRRSGLLRRQGRAEEHRGVADDRELLRLLLGNVARDGHDLRHIGQLVEPTGELVGRRDRGRQDVDRIGRRRRIRHEIEQRRDRFRLRVLEVERIEVEAPMRQQHEAGRGDDGGRRP